MNKKTLLLRFSLLLLAMLGLAIFSCALVEPIVDTNTDSSSEADVTSPTISITEPSGNISIDSNVYTVRGTASDNKDEPYIYLKLNNGFFGSVTTGTNWSKTLSLVEGPNTISVFAVDKAGNVSETNSVIITVNSSSPIIEFLSPSNSSITNSSPIVIVGIARLTNEIDGTFITNVQASVNGGAYITITNANSNIVNWTANMNLTTGTNSIAIRGYSDNGKGGTSNMLYIIYDGIAPVNANILATNFNANSYSLQGDVSDNFTGVYKVYVKIDSGSFIEMNVVSGSWSTNYTGLSYSKHTNYVYAVDNANNLTITNEIEITNLFDTNAPVLSNTKGTNFVYNSYSLQGDISDNLTGVYKVYVKLDGGAFKAIDSVSGSWSTNYDFLSYTKHTNWVYAVDNAGNSTITNEIEITNLFDTNAPVLSVITPVNNQVVYAPLYTLEGDAIDNYSGAGAVYIKTNFGNFNFVSVNGLGHWSTTISGLSKTNYTNYIYTVDYAGNTSSTNMIVITANPPKKINADDKEVDDKFGISAAISSDGNTLIIGAHGDDNMFDLDVGAAYRYHTTDDGDTWTKNKLTAFDRDHHDYFGSSVAISGDGNQLLVGTQGNNAAYRYYTTDGGSTWDQQKIVAYDGNSSDEFGFSVAISADGNSLFIGSPYDDDKGTWSGSVYRMHTADGGSTWSTNKIVAYDGDLYDTFGINVAISANGNTLLVGANSDDDKGSGSGSVYRFHTADGGSTWSTNKIVAYDGNVDDSFGRYIAISADGNTLLVGAPYDDDKGANSGSVYRFHTTDGGSTWSTNKILAYDGNSGDNFGSSVAISADGNILLIGAKGNGEKANGAGATYRMHTTDGGTTWTTNKILAYDGAESDYFGSSVSISSNGNAWVIGAMYDNSPSDDEGSAYWWGE